jgi:hypothetical protein
MTTWLPLDFHDITDAEYEVADSLSKALDEYGASTVQVTALGDDLQPTTTVAVLSRPTERLLLIIREDRSIVAATDDVLSKTWCDR